MEIILYIMAFAWLSNLITWRLDLPLWIRIKKEYLDYQILKCPTCCAFWITIPINFIVFTNPFLWITIPFVCSYLATLMENQLNKFF